MSNPTTPSNVKLLLHFDGSNGQTTAVDSSLSARAVTVAGSAALSTAQSKFGNASTLMGGNARWTVPDSPDWAFGSGQFTMEAWVYFTAAPASNDRMLMGQWSSQNSTYFGFVGGNFGLYYYTADFNSLSVGAAWAPSLNGWHHVATDRDANNILRVYVDGAVLASGTASGTLFDAAVPLEVGGSINVGGPVGYMDEVRITKGEALYGGAFTPPTAAFPDPSAVPGAALTGAAAAVATATGQLTAGAAPAITDAQYVAWLPNRSARRTVLVEATVLVNGVSTTRYMATRAYVSGPTDTPPNTTYPGIVGSSAARFIESISITGTDSRLAINDLEISNPSGVRDSWLDDVWANGTIKAYFGDVSWSRNDFRMIFNGLSAKNLDSGARDKLNAKLRDKFQRLDTPLTEDKLGGSTPNKDEIIPVPFGEVHNVTPLLTNPTTLEYQVGRWIQGVIEVRDNGIPIANDSIGWAAVTVDLTTGKLLLSQSPAGAITCSVQGDKTGGAYASTVSAVVQRTVTAYGKASDRFTPADLDATNLAAFNSANQQLVGTYVSDRTNVIEVIRQLAASVGAQPAMSRLGLLQLIQVAIPTSATRSIMQYEMEEGSLHIAQRPDVKAAVKLGFCKNWTDQPALQTTIPAQHKDLFDTVWLTETAVDAAVQAAYRLSADPDQEDTSLQRRADAAPEAARRRDLWKVQRTVFEFEAYASCLDLVLGQAVWLYNTRFNLSAGKLGMVISLAPDWHNGRVVVQVLT